MSRVSLMTHIVAGYPSLEASENLIMAMAEAGVSFIEIQIPFSDPVADGATIMQANQQALLQGITPEDCFKLMGRLTAKIDTPLLFMTYYNIVFRYGVENFCKKAKQAGAYGLIIPDIPYHEEKNDHFLRVCRQNKLHAIQVISPITPERRLKQIAKVASGFVYCVSRTGITGESKKLNPQLQTYIKRIRQYVSLPLALGFGISDRDQVLAANESVDIVVIGSKIINIINSSGDEGYLKNVSSFLAEIFTIFPETTVEISKNI